MASVDPPLWLLPTLYLCGLACHDAISWQIFTQVMATALGIYPRLAWSVSVSPQEEQKLPCTGRIIAWGALLASASALTALLRPA